MSSHPIPPEAPPCEACGHLPYGKSTPRVADALARLIGRRSLKPQCATYTRSAIGDVTYCACTRDAHSVVVDQALHPFDEMNSYL